MNRQEKMPGIDDIDHARRRIVDALKAKGQMNLNTMGSIPCEVCGSGKIVYTYHGKRNKHIHAHCTTEDCLNWME